MRVREEVRVVERLTLPVWSHPYDSTLILSPTQSLLPQLLFISRYLTLSLHHTLPVPRIPLVSVLLPIPYCCPYCNGPALETNPSAILRPYPTILSLWLYPYDPTPMALPQRSYLRSYPYHYLHPYLTPTALTLWLYSYPLTPTLSSYRHFSSSKSLRLSLQCTLTLSSLLPLPVLLPLPLPLRLQPSPAPTPIAKALLQRT